MFGNKYDGDSLAKEFYKLVTLKKIASEGEQDENLAADLLNHVEDEIIDPSRFLNSLDPEPELTSQLEGDVNDLDSWAEDQIPKESVIKNDTPQYPESLSYLLDSNASVVLNGLGKLAGSLKQRGEGFAADMVEATALSIRSQMIKEASQKLETITILSKIASDISGEGDEFTSDIVKATISRIKKQEG